MSNLFEDRERGYEAKWSHDEEMRFRILTLQNVRVARWAAELMRLPSDQLAQYEQAMIAVGMTHDGSDKVIAKVRDDLALRNVSCPESTIRRKMRELFIDAERELTSR
jgi:hypothetical protein